jgi:hypothetical protein
VIGNGIGRQLLVGVGVGRLLLARRRLWPGAWRMEITSWNTLVVGTYR